MLSNIDPEDGGKKKKQIFWHKSPATTRVRKPQSVSTAGEGSEVTNVGGVIRNKMPSFPGFPRSILLARG